MLKYESIGSSKRERRAERLIDGFRTEANVSLYDLIQNFSDFYLFLSAFESKISTYSGADPLSVYYEYIFWYEQNYPLGENDID